MLKPYRLRAGTGESDLLSDYKTAVVSPNMSDTRHELEQYLSLPVTDTTMLRFWQEQSNSGKLQKLAMMQPSC